MPRSKAQRWKASNELEAAARARLVQLLADSYDDPDLFNTAVLRRPPYWSGKPKGYAGQLEWCDSVVKYKKIAIETGNALGKDYWVGGIIPWWLYTRKDSLVVVTGPSQTLLGTVTWKEVRRSIGRAPWNMGAEISEGVKASPQTVKLNGQGWGALGFSTTSVERASGQHAGELLVVVEESSGVADEAWEAIDSLGATKIIAIGNPLRAEGGFVDLCNQAMKDATLGIPPEEAVCWHKVPSWAGPDADFSEAEIIATRGRKVGLATRTWIEGIAREWGRTSPYWLRHIAAERPKQSHETLIPPELLDRCPTEETRDLVRALRREGMGGRVRIGIDVGEGVGKSRSVVLCRDDLGILEIDASPFEKETATAQAAARMCKRRGVKAESVSFDANGTGGKRLQNALEAVGLGASRAYFGPSSGGSRCTNLRTAVALAIARRLDPEHYRGKDAPEWVPFHVEPDEHWLQLREELAALKCGLAGKKAHLEPKEDLADRLGRSPDYADALGMTFRDSALEGR